MVLHFNLIPQASHFIPFKKLPTHLGSRLKHVIGLLFHATTSLRESQGRLLEALFHLGAL